MKRTLTVLVLIISILPELCAQVKSQEDKAFEIPDNIVINRRFYIDLEKGNKLEIELTDITDLQKISNIDSLLNVVINDLMPLKDSFSDPLTAKRVDYATDQRGRKKIRIQQYRPKGESYLLNNGELSSLKISQDTLNIIGIIVNPPKANQKISLTHPRYYHLVFYLNNIDELKGYMNGALVTKIETIQKGVEGKWPTVLGTGFHYLKNDKSITGDKPHGFTAGGNGDFLTGIASVNIQNYKSYFLPSFSLGVRLTMTNRDRTFKWEPGLSWEPHFLFAKDANDKLKTYRNDFLTLTYGQGGVKDHDPRKDFSFSAVFSLGYLIHQSGEFIEENTFRLGAGRLNLLKTTIEPSIYFDHFFKGVTPCIRISQNF